MHVIRILIADHQVLTRRGLKALLDGEGGIEVVGEASSSQEVFALVKERKPHIVLMNMELPPLGGIGTTMTLKLEVPEIEVVLISGRDPDDRVMEAMEVGASGFVLTDISPENLVRVIRSVADGGTVIHPKIIRRLVHRLSSTRNGTVRAEGLSVREWEILLHIAQGFTDREIATRLHISETTVKTHVRSILKKTQTRNRTEAVTKVLYRRTGTV
ncbi:MAG: response regulator transcription factor [Armatimonadota bacterium]|nr:response regulator transcription factor [Armatimonadota bacterium]MDR5703455.1 response regulator transcription factor [Armatimonadota bacterium]MDR7435539.1 response regulator transcription factor [Armatimonadota bacterium]